MDSSPLSFHSAPSTPLSMISSIADNDQINLVRSLPNERNAIPLPHELRNICMIYFEEQLYSNALILLTNLMAAGTSDLESASYIPPKSAIRLAHTLLVHPLHTTRAATPERLEVSSHSFNFLRTLLSIVGPGRANVNDALSFRPWNRTRVRRGSDSNREQNSDDSSTSDSLQLKLATHGSLWMRASDFWSVVGWGFNCSIVHTRRWQYWKVWLEYMVDLLDTDWREHESRGLDDNAHKSPPDSQREEEETESRLGTCLLIQYVQGGTGRTANLRRIVRAIFADGDVDSMRAFPEVFENETKERKSQPGLKRKRDLEVDIENDKWADYAEDEEDCFEEPASQYLQANLPPSSGGLDELKNQDGSSDYGGPKSVALRLRLLSLLSRLALKIPRLFTRIADLYDLLCDSIRPLPLPIFCSFISTTATTHFSVDNFSPLVQYLLSRLLHKSAPSSYTVSKREDNGITQEVLEQCFLPFSANTSSVEDNAKVSIMVETLFRLFATMCVVRPSQTLNEAVEKGIAAREERANGDKRKRHNSAKIEERRDRKLLEASGKRLRALIRIIPS